MGILEKIKNQITRTETVKSVGDNDILKWLGLDNVSVSNDAVYFTCLKKLSETLGVLPIKFYQQTKDGKIRAAPNKAYELMSTRPNPIMTPTTFFSALEMNRNHYGNGYAWIRKKYVKEGKYGGQIDIMDVWIMPSDNVSLLIDNKGVFGNQGQIYYNYSDAYSGESFVFKPDDVIHVKTHYTYDGIRGEPVRKILEDTLNGNLESQKFMNNLYKEGLTASMALQYTGDLDDKRIKKLQKKYQDYLSGAKNAGKVVPVPIGLQLQPLNVKLTDAQFFELKKYTALQIAAAFGIKPNQLNDYEKSSYSNSESQQLSFLVETMLYIVKQYEEEMNFKLLTCEERQKGMYLKFNEKAILRTDSQTQMEILSKAVNNGIYTPNESRAFLDLPDVVGGNIPIVNGNYIPLTDVGNQYKKGGKDDA